MREPIMEYADQAELDASLAEWQDRLFLNDWIIKAAIVDKCADINGKNCIATNTHNHDNKDAFIEIERLSGDHEGHYCKLPQEGSLVHELLHCKYCWFSYDEENADGCVLNVYHHQQLEQMAKSLIMAKYGIGFDWFKA